MSENCEISYTTMLSEKGRPLKIVDNFKFRFHKYLADNVERWCCSVNSRCRSYLKIQDAIIVDANLTHDEHDKEDKHVLQRQQISNYLKRKAIDDMSIRPSKLLRAELKKPNPPPLLDMHDVHLIQKNISHNRIVSLAKLPTNLNESHMEYSDVIGDILMIGIHNYSFEQKLELKKKKPTPHLSLETVDGKTIRKFQLSWYSKYTWLAGSEKLDKLFCYYCLLFGGEKTWSTDGISVMKNFDRKAIKHAISKSHLISQEQYILLGSNRIEHALSEGHRLIAIRHNETVGVNRHILSRLIHVICFLGKQEIAFQDQKEGCSSINKGNYLELLDLLFREEQLLKEHYMSSSVFKVTSSDIQNHLISCVTSVLKTKISNELQKANFVSIQTDETTDVSCKSQISIIFRYVVDNNIEERFIGFFDTSKDKSASGLSEILLTEIKNWKIGDKLVCQTYDGAAVMAGQNKGVQAIIKQSYPKAMFIHCYAHQLNLVFLHGSKSIKSVRIFISDLTMFHSFFSRSPKRSQLLREKGFELPQNSEMVWNYHSRTAETITTHFIELKEAMTCVTEEDDWDPMSISMAYGLLHKLSNPTFVYLLFFFKKLFLYSDHVFVTLQTKCTSDVQYCVNEIKTLSDQLTFMRNEEEMLNCCTSATELNSELQYSEKNKTDLKNLSYEILDSLIEQIEIRFKDFMNLKFVELTNNKEFKNNNIIFPIHKLMELKEHFPDTFDLERLRNELEIIYSTPDKHFTPIDLLNYLYINNLQEVYQELFKLLQLVLSFPVTTCERNTSTLKRIKSFLINSMNNDQLSNLSFLAIEKQMLNELTADPTFIDEVIDVFAKTKSNKIELTYKVI